LRHHDDLVHATLVIRLHAKTGGLGSDSLGRMDLRVMIAGKGEGTVKSTALVTRSGASERTEAEWVSSLMAMRIGWCERAAAL
jgi:hypothetical protein